MERCCYCRAPKINKMTSSSRRHVIGLFAIIVTVESFLFQPTNSATRLSPPHGLLHSQTSQSSRRHPCHHPHRPRHQLNAAAAAGSGQQTAGQIKKTAYIMIKDVEELMKTNATLAPERALENLARIQTLHTETNNAAYQQLEHDLYNSLIRAYAKTGSTENAERAEETFDLMKTKPWAQPDATTICGVVDGYANCGRKSAPHNAERFLFRIMDEAEAAQLVEGKSKDDVLFPTSEAANAVIKSWSKLKNKEGALRALGILERMEHLQQSARGGALDIHPTVYSYSTVIAALRGLDGLEAAQKGEDILDKLCRAAADATAEEESDDEDAETTGQVVRPNTVLWNSVIDLYAASGHPTAGTKALELLNRMRELQKEGNADVAPDGITYRIVMNAFAGSGHLNAAKSAEAVLEMAENDGMPKETRTYNVLLKAWASSKLPGAALRAEEILRTMIDAADEADNHDGGPDVYSFTTVLSALARTTEPGKAQRAKDLLDEQIRFYNVHIRDENKPNSLSFNCVLNAAAFSAKAVDAEEHKRALQIAIQTFNELLKSGYCQADDVSYGTMMKCIANLVPRSNSALRNQMASKIFQKTCESGYVSDLALKELRRCCSGRFFSSFLEEQIEEEVGIRPKFRSPDSITLDVLPRKWSSEVKSGKRRKQRPRKQRSNNRTRGRKNRRDKDASTAKDDEIIQLVPIVQMVETSWQSGRDV